jgi:hypothetical protein
MVSPAIFAVIASSLGMYTWQLGSMTISSVIVSLERIGDFPGFLGVGSARLLTSR